MTRRRTIGLLLSAALFLGLQATQALPARADAPTAMGASVSSFSIPLLTSPNVGAEVVFTLSIDPGYSYSTADIDYVAVGDDPVPHQVTQIDDQDCTNHPTGPTCTVYVRTWSQLWQDAHEPRSDVEIFDECTGSFPDENCVYARIPFTFGPDAADRFVPALPSTPAQLDFTDVPAGTTAVHDVPIRPDDGFAFAYPFIDGQVAAVPGSPFQWRDGTCARGVVGDCAGQMTYGPSAPMPSTAYRFAVVENRGPVWIYPANLGWLGHGNAIGQAPQFTSADTAAFRVGTPGSAIVTTAGAPAAQVRESGALPNGVSFTAHADGTAAIAGTPAPGTVGSYPITLTATNGVGPDATQAFTLTVIKAATTTTLAVSPSATQFGRPVTLTATVASPASSPTGVVDFYDNGALLGEATLGSAGTATLRVASLPAGNDALTAAYRGDRDHGESTSDPVRETITYSRCVTSTTTSVTVAPGEAVCVTGTVTGSVTVRPGGSLALVGAHILGSISTTDGGAVTICGSTIGINVTVVGTTGPVLIGSMGDAGSGCSGNRIAGAFTVRNNLGGLEIAANDVVGETTVNDNVTAAHPGTEIAGNSFSGTLSCRGNTPPPSDAGHANTFLGLRFGQCLASRL